MKKWIAVVQGGGSFKTLKSISVDGVLLSELKILEVDYRTEPLHEVVLTCAIEYSVLRRAYEPTEETIELPIPTRVDSPLNSLSIETTRIVVARHKLTVDGVELYPRSLELMETRDGRFKIRLRMNCANFSVLRTSQQTYVMQWDSFFVVEAPTPAIGIGDLSCRNNARSNHLRCAINPSGPCEGCGSFEFGGPIKSKKELLHEKHQLLIQLSASSLELWGQRISFDQHRAIAAPIEQAIAVIDAQLQSGFERP